MPHDIFMEDVAPGSPTTINEVKNLILFALGGRSLSFAVIHESLRERDLVNYFELVHALGELISSGHVTVESEGEIEYYQSTALGEKTVEELGGSLPPSVRKKAVDSVERAINRQRRLSEVRTDIIPDNGGYRLYLSLPDAETELISLSVFTTTREESENMRNRFLNDPLYVYKSIMELLSGQKGFLGDISQAENHLF